MAAPSCLNNQFFINTGKGLVTHEYVDFLWLLVSLIHGYWKIKTVKDWIFLVFHNG